MNAARTRSLAPSTRRYEAAVARPAPAITFRNVRRGFIAQSSSSEPPNIGLPASDVWNP